MIGGGLFSRYFLDEGIGTTAAFKALGAANIGAFRAEAAGLLAGFLDADGPSEAETEDGLVFPLLRLLGWHLLPQQATTTRRENIPDALLFLDQAQAAAARRLARGHAARFFQASVVHESKAWDVALDRGAGPD